MRWQEKQKLWLSGRDQLFLFLFIGIVTVIPIARCCLSGIINGALSAPQHINLLLCFAYFIAIVSVINPGVDQQRQAKDGPNHSQ